MTTGTSQATVGDRWTDSGRTIRYIAARLIRGRQIRGAGDPRVPGANPAVNPREAQALLAPARQLTPQADERERLAGRDSDPRPCAIRARRRVLGLRSPAGAEPACRRPDTATVTPAATGGAGVASRRTAASTAAHPTVPGYVAKIINGVAYAPSYAPMQVKKAIWAGNQIRHKPYIFGGGHGSFKDPATTARARSPTCCTPRAC